MVTFMDILGEVLFGINLRNVYGTVSKNVVFLAVPLLVGVFVQKTFPRLPEFSSIILKWILGPISCVITIFPAVLGIWQSYQMGFIKFIVSSIKILSFLIQNINTELILADPGCIRRYNCSECGDFTIGKTLPSRV